MNVAVIFDLDGTLVVFKFDGQAARKAIVEELVSMGFDRAALEKVGPTQGVVDEAKRRIDNGDVPVDFDEVRSRVFNILDRYELSGRDGRVAFPGTLSTLRYLHSKGVRMGLLTNSGKTSTEDALSRAGISGEFEFVLTRDEVGSMKPDPHGMAMALQRLELPASSVFYVGDGMYDIQVARAVGLKVISVATGNYTEERLRQEGAEVVIPSIGDLPSALGV